MTAQQFTIMFSVDQTPAQVFDAINNVGAWWSGEIEGDTDQPGAAFTYRYKDMHSSKQQITEFIPGRKVVWRVVDSNLKFTNTKNEWTGTDIVFEIAQKEGRTELRFTHAGLAPNFECYNSCSNAWGRLVGANLRNLITSGKAQPDVFA